MERGVLSNEVIFVEPVRFRSRIRDTPRTILYHRIVHEDLGSRMPPIRYKKLQVHVYSKPIFIAFLRWFAVLRS